MPLPIPGPGRKKLFETPEQMEALAENYFVIQTEKKQKFTLAGIALHLGMSYQSFLRYEADPTFCEVVNQLKSRVLNQAETELYGPFSSGARFHASQLGMSEKAQIESKNTNVNANLSAEALKDLTDEQLASLSGILTKLTQPSASGSGNSASEAKQDQNPVSGLGAVSP